MSGSEDGQLRSGGEDHRMSGDEHDTDSLDIKPPQANVAYSRDSAGPRRKEKTSKDKKHSKDRKHKERGGVMGSGVRETRGGGSGGERDHRSDGERRDHRRDERNVMDQRYQQQQRGGYEREDLMPNNERRFPKHYERGSGEVGDGRGGGANHNYHHHHPPQQPPHYHPGPMHLSQRPRQDYYERGANYHHGGGMPEYHVNRHQPFGKHGGGGGGHGPEYGHHDVGGMADMPRDRRKYNYEHQNDAESLEQDLRSRLLSKRHKYVKGNSETEEQYEMRSSGRRGDSDRNEHSYEEERDRVMVKHKVRREKPKDVIEVFDSPDVQEEETTHQRRKHKRRNKERLPETTEKRRTTPDDPELLARREKFLAAEREKEKRKESAREELEARREMRRERVEVGDALSPGAVAASVTAGLNVVVKRKKKDGEHVKRKRAKKAKDLSEDDDEDDQEDDSETEEGEHDAEEDSLSGSDTGDESVKNYKTKSKTKKPDRSDDVEDVSDDDDIQLSKSPYSIGDLAKSPKRQKKQKNRYAKRSDDDDDDETGHVDERSSRSLSDRSRRSHSHSHSRSQSVSHSRSRSRSRSRSQQLSRSRSRSRQSSHSRSRSRSPLSQSRSPRSRSRSRTEERDMKSNDRKSDANDVSEAESAKKKPQHNGEESPLLDDKGVPLPNYYPDIQGCRSVEEFQCLNRIEEGTYGVVYRAKDKRTNEIVALKRLKMEKEKEGFPITSLREINTLLKGQHPNIVTVREIVVGSNMDKIFIVMDYVEHDLKSLMETMKTRKQSFFPGEVKCLTQQLLRAVGHLHDNWILHRDLKTSNLLLSHKGILKVGDFGLAREYGSPLKKYTSLVVTLWYRAPELLLCSKEYSTPIDIWSVGCIFGEFLQMLPMFPGKSEIDELNRIFKELGTPNEKIWPGYKELPAVKNLLSQNSQFTEYPVSNLRKRFNDKTSETGVSLLQGLLTYDPKQRLNADAALKHAYFKELPLPIDPSMFPTWPAKSELGARKALASSPKPPSGGSQFKQLGRDDLVAGGGKVSGIISGNKKTNTGFVLNAGIDQRQLAMGPGFSLKF